MNQNNGRVYNFSAGPSMLPLEVMENVAKELTNYKGCGQSVMEMSHRSKEFQAIIDEADKNLRTLMNIPENYKVLFLQGGGTLQFSMVPMNLLRKSGKADYLVTGAWAKKAAAEAKKFGDIKIVASSEEAIFSYIPQVKREDFREDADYVHITFNNTIYGTHFGYIPDTGDIPLVADMSSCILSEEIDVSKFGLIYAGAQKNIAPAGVTIVIIREDLIGFAAKEIPTYLDYKVHAENGSMYNTPPCFTIYVAGEVFSHILKNGGIPPLHQLDVEKADKLYKYIDESKLYSCPVQEDSRSLMNVVFVTGDADLDKKFVAEAKAKGLVNLGGHRSIGGMRASIYNAMPMEGVETLIAFMKAFEAENVK
ncbi:3-phosphoserine/phosphohydroxythreonine transaminase [Aminipila butyrica]|uniref:Phosphoserine aminotransferase n=1 Tax=Aminipila butyrica TaxID=433296 RepID=A0A858BSL9_9FIRM|nr:3-phosphoserine/phosphohydroxythreonine transaminase [Aminipila butyrica]QIB68362.1 3-phosphoserine/phosphohydroxythreonine transaminase [Aminipila butyrica]